MTNMTEITRTIRKARRNGATLRAIGKDYGITLGTVARILTGSYPDAANAKRLGIPAKCPQCKRVIPIKKQPAPKRIADYFLYWILQ